jgi:hypothetical protein
MARSGTRGFVAQKLLHFALPPVLGLNLITVMASMVAVWQEPLGFIRQFPA